MPSAIRPFQIQVANEVLQDLQQRLQHTRWPEAEVVDDWSQGVPLQWLKPVCTHWQDRYDWRTREAALNRFTQFVTEIDGLDIHFIHMRSPHPEARPLLLTHGWPGSVVEFHKVIEPLTDPTRFGGRAEDAFHVVCPSLPGFAFSGKPTQVGWGIGRISQAWATLMQRLGYTRYGAQGGDWGSSVTACLGAMDAAHCVGIHITLAVSAPPPGKQDWTHEEQRALQGLAEYKQWGAGYSAQQATRPQTLGYGLSDSPVGQAAWILEKFHAWADCAGDPLNIFSVDELLDNVMLYWVTASATSSARLYWESFGKEHFKLPVQVPTGVTVFPKEFVCPVREWMAPRFINIVYWNEAFKGGHFAAFEQPSIFVEEVRNFFRTLDFHHE